MCNWDAVSERHPFFYGPTGASGMKASNPPYNVCTEVRRGRHGNSKENGIKTAKDIMADVPEAEYEAGIFIEKGRIENSGHAVAR